MKVLVVGSEGYIGQALIARLLSGVPLAAGAVPAQQITRLDVRMGAAATDDRLRAVEGDISDREVLNRAIGGGVDCVFHLASIPGGAAEKNFELGLKVNLQATIDLLEVLRLTGQNPRLIFASTIGIYGVPMPAVIDEQTVPEPSLSRLSWKWPRTAAAPSAGRPTSCGFI